ncbi:ABC transporter [Kribbella sp. WER1]
MALITALMKLRGVLAGSQLPLEVVGADEARQQQKAMLDQLDDYLLPRLVQLEAPILAVVGGSTGAGKSTLVNTVIGKVVSEPGVLRPTTRSPVLIHHPADADWFVGDRVLPGMARTASEEPGGMEDPGQLRLVAADSVPRGLAILDAPDIDSVVEANRDLATQLLAAADLWLFVTTAARYSDAVPWEFLQSASDRSTAVAVVLDRAPSETIDDITGHLAQMLLERGLGDSPLFSIQETVVDGNGMLPSAVVAGIKDWLVDLAADAEARAGVVRRTLQGAVSAMVKKTPPFAAAVKAQAETALELRSSVESAYDEGVKDIAKASQDGTLLRGEVLARWQQFVGTGELLKGLQSNGGRLRDRLKSSLGNKPTETRDVSDAIQSGLESLLTEHATASAERAEKLWQGTAPGRQLLAAADADGSAGGNGAVSGVSAASGAAGARSAAGGSAAAGGNGGASGRRVAGASSAAGGAVDGAKGAGPGGKAGAGGNDVVPSLGTLSEQFPAAASRTVREWQAFVLDLVRTEGADKKSTAKILEYGVNGLGLSLMVVMFASAAGIPKGAQASAGAGSAVVGQRLLEAVFGDKAVQGMVDKAREDLDGKVHALMDAEFARYLAVLDQHPVDAETAKHLTEAARAVEDCT